MSEKQLSDKILEWLEKHGYPLELRTAQSLQKSGLEVIQSAYYPDPETSNKREIDIIAYKNHAIDNTGFIFSLVVECKSSKKYPWVVFTSKSISQKSYGSYVLSHIFSSRNGKSLVNQLLAKDDFVDLEYFQIKERVGHSVTRGLTDGDKDVTFAAVNSVIKASHALVNLTNKSIVRVCRLYFPTIVIDSNLYECYLDENSEMKVEEIEEAQLILNNSDSSKRVDFVYVVTEKFLNKHIEKFKDFTEFVVNNCQNELKEIANNFSTNAPNVV